MSTGARSTFERVVDEDDGRGALEVGADADARAVAGIASRARDAL